MLCCTVLGGSVNTYRINAASAPFIFTKQLRRVNQIHGTAATNKIHYNPSLHCTALHYTSLLLIPTKKLHTLLHYRLLQPFYHLHPSHQGVLFLQWLDCPVAMENCNARNHTRFKYSFRFNRIAKISLHCRIVE